MQRIEFEPAFVIHSRPYRDTSLIATFFTENHGIVSGVVRGQRQTSRKKSKTPLIPFTPLLITLQGKASLKLVSHFEWQQNTIVLQGRTLYSGMYVNELIVRLLPEWDSHPAVFSDYQWSLNALDQGADVEVILRQFESRLLTDLGVNISWQQQANSDKPICENEMYRLDVESGFVRVATGTASEAFEGKLILQVAAGEWHSDSVKRLAKTVHRQLLHPLLGSKPLQSRQLFT
ncbi:DNA repair protein RecO [Gilvimarinus sp. SDUM040013]|uniref:DNA repair protein RecO n=1 Tax=Gilvimarinus gilvus TaxID=3058038 RepID=A0ABU4RY20_9GAMM|nr:DNA repair protein RecO [Gilvimarinus sp. SDUM040013]MDO3386480.1 DNA repair protein RecO [Gilvimarinus sp. SDUM040013]MDX6849056.1 DNA repair protein RecO [Gilvimarinus sp. SDUM040013]